ncbi:GNAT family N-acetyltransferase [Ruegeria marina]|uniref:Ribosomal protein S18 acetylase RimI n=1 Tax=Ruegeria marina TaxID=639004 RepID=A0A1G6QCA4_9RHOB|nr:N-acetyltransferase [Ruegeria marina]SDC89316.1 Ribosomal protein S18 acetylase RimI [Ruegeria marina]
MTIRPAKPADLPAIRALHLTNWRASYAGVLPADFLGAPVEHEMDMRWAAMPPEDDILMVAGAVAGFVLVRPDHPEGPLVESLHVDAKARGTGLGEALIRAVAEELRRRAFGCMWLEVLDENASARRFYRRINGVEGPVFTDEICGNPVSARRVCWAFQDNFPGAGEKIAKPA